MGRSREYVRSVVEASLKRLNVEQVDLYYQHRVERSLPTEESWEALKVHQKNWNFRCFLGREWNGAFQ